MVDSCDNEYVQHLMYNHITEQLEMLEKTVIQLKCDKYTKRYKKFELFVFF